MRNPSSYELTRDERTSQILQSIADGVVLTIRTAIQRQYRSRDNEYEFAQISYAIRAASLIPPMAVASPVMRSLWKTSITYMLSPHRFLSARYT